MPLFEIVPINLLTNETGKLFSNDVDDDVTLQIKESNTFCVGFNTISKLINHTKYPIEKTKAISNILSFIQHLDNKKKDETSIHNQCWVDYFTTKHYKEYQRILKELNIISLVPYSDGEYYIKGERSYLFRLMNEFINDKELCIIIFEKSSTRSLNVFGKYNSKYKKTVKNVTINYKTAIKDEVTYYHNNPSSNRLNSLRQRLSIIFNLNNDRFIKTGDKSNRVYSSLSNISRVSRKHLNVKNQYFTGIDISNSQPLLLCYYLKENKLPIDKNYIQDCEDGLIYDRFYGVEGCDLITKKNSNGTWYKITEEKSYSKENRSELKEDLFQSIYYYFKPNFTINKSFQQIYPLTYGSLIRINNELKGENDNLAVRLQNVEAEIMNDIIPEKSEYYFTLFDGLYFTNLNDIPQLKREIENRFSKYGLTPKISIDY